MITKVLLSLRVTMTIPQPFLTICENSLFPLEIVSGCKHLFHLTFDMHCNVQYIVCYNASKYLVS